MTDRSEPPVGVVLDNVLVTYSPQPTSYTGVVSMIVAKDGDELGVFDTGVADFMPESLIPALASLGTEPDAITAICSTHGHFDHAGGSVALRDLSDAPVYLSPLDVDLAQFTPDVPLYGGDRVRLGSLTFEVVETPGHTAGCVCFYEPTLRLLIAGDAVQGSGSATYGLLPVYFQSGTAYRDGLRRLLELDLDALVMGHPLEWSRTPSCVHLGESCTAMLQESLEASSTIAEVAQAVHHETGWTDLPAIRHEMLTRLARHAMFEDFDPNGVLGASTDATIRSEFRDLGVNLD